MEERSFSVFRAIRFGFIRTFDNLGLVLGSFLVLCFVQVMSVAILMLNVGMEIFKFFHTIKSFDPRMHVIAQHVGKHVLKVKSTGAFWMSGWVTVVLMILSVAIGLLYLSMKIGFSKMQLDIYDRGDSKFDVLFSRFGAILRYLVATWLYAMMVVVGLGFFVIPGIYLALRYFFYPYAIAENKGIIESLKISAKLTCGSKLKILALIFLTGIVNSLGAAAFGLGLLITIPATGLAFAFAYRVMSAQLPVSECGIKI